MKEVFYAYDQTRAGVETVMRMQAVKRWHMIETTRQQTLAEHSANVAMLAYYVAVTAPGMWFGHGHNVAIRALVHDVGEVFIGDIPSHTKKAVGIRDQMHDLEASVIPPEFSRLMSGHSEHVDALIKACDLADGIRFVRLHGVDLTAKHAQIGLEQQFKELIAGMQTYRVPFPLHVIEHIRHTVMFYAYEMS